MMSTTDPTSIRAAVGRGLAQSAADDVMDLGDFTNFVHAPDRREAQGPREIAFEDVRAGDKIRATLVLDGLVLTREGVAHENACGWFTRSGGLIVTAPSGATITLLHRPVPAEPKGLGAVVRARVRQSITDRTLVRTPDHDFPWRGERSSLWRWDDLDPDTIEVLWEGIEVLS